MDYPHLERQFAEELTALEKSGEYLAFTITPSEAWYLFALLQVMLRDPKVATLPEIGPFVREFADRIEQRLCKTPAMALIARRGWT